MHANLRVSWYEHPHPREVEAEIIRAQHPPLNIDHASGAALDIIKAARRRYYESAGPRPH
jgi:hypothetical protein